MDKEATNEEGGEGKFGDMFNLEKSDVSFVSSSFLLEFSQKSFSLFVFKLLVISFDLLNLFSKNIALFFLDDCFCCCIDVSLKNK